MRNTTLPQRTRAQAQLQLSQMHAYTRFTQINNRCIEGGKSRGVLSDFRMARVWMMNWWIDGANIIVNININDSKQVAGALTLLGLLVPFPTQCSRRQYSRREESELVVSRVGSWRCHFVVLGGGGYFVQYINGWRSGGGHQGVCMYWYKLHGTDQVAKYEINHLWKSLFLYSLSHKKPNPTYVLLQYAVPCGWIIFFPSFPFLDPRLAALHVCKNTLRGCQSPADLHNLQHAIYEWIPISMKRILNSTSTLFFRKFLLIDAHTSSLISRPQ